MVLHKYLFTKISNHSYAKAYYFHFDYNFLLCSEWRVQEKKIDYNNKNNKFPRETHMKNSQLEVGSSSHIFYSLYYVCSVDNNAATTENDR